MSSKTILTARLILASILAIGAAGIIIGAAGNKSEEAMELSESSITAIPIAQTLPEEDIKEFEYAEIAPDHDYVIETDYSLIFNDATPVEEPEEETTEVEYTVQAGDALWDIACNFYGDGYMYSYIKDLNGLTSDTIYKGQVLTIKTTLTDDEKAQAYKESQEEIRKANEAKKAASQSTSNSSGSYTSAKNHLNSYEGRNLEYIGDFFITGYDPWCSHCCGKSKPNAITASGAVAQVGVTVAMNKKYPFGTQIYIEGYGVYTVQDRGVKDGMVDIAAASHEACYELTGYNIPVYIIH